MKAKLVVAFGTVPIIYFLGVILSFIGVRLSDNVLRVSHSMDGFIIVIIVAFTLSGFTLVISLFMNLVLSRKGKVSFKRGIMFSLLSLIMCSFLSFLIYLQCDAQGLEHFNFMSLEKSVLIENILKGVITSIIPSQAAWWFYAWLFKRKERLNSPS
jgi:uncharacterized membrane protein